MDLSLFSGDSRNIIVSLMDQNNVLVPISGATIEWILISQGATILSKEVGSGIVISNPTAGQFTLTLASKDTRPLNGIYQHMARVTTSDGNSSIVFTGMITVQESLI